MNKIAKQINIDSEMLQQHIISLAQVMKIAKEQESCIFPVNGDCLAGAGIDNGDFIAVSFRRFPRPPKYMDKDGINRQDQCLCFAKFPGEPMPAVMIKEYHGKWGSYSMVSTRYKQEKGKPYHMNAGFFALAIIGVVFACWDSAGLLKWQCDLNDYPEKLETAPTIHGGNCGDPQEVKPIPRKVGDCHE